MLGRWKDPLVSPFFEGHCQVDVGGRSRIKFAENDVFQSCFSRHAFFYYKVGPYKRYKNGVITPINAPTNR